MSSSNLMSRTEEIFTEELRKVHVRTDRLFAWLMGFQWLFAMVCALVVSPRAWEGTETRTHIHVWAAGFLGAAILSLPVFLALTRPGHRTTRHCIALSQMLFSGLLIHLTGGRIETHFHVFGSLALLAFYRDWRVLLTASTVVALDHVLRGYFWPQSVYGVLGVQPWRWLEHAGWVVYENIFLTYSCVQSLKQLREISSRQAELERVNAHIEQEIHLRTEELRQTHSDLEAQRARSTESAKMAALGEMAGGIAHEINNPLTTISGSAGQLKELAEAGMIDKELAVQFGERIESTAMRIARIVKSLRSFAREADNDPFQSVPLKAIIDETIELCCEKFRSHGTKLEVQDCPDTMMIECRGVQISQVLLNLLNNARDATEGLEEKWVRLCVRDLGGEVELSVTDSGKGIPVEIRDKILRPFFTTKEVGKGTGLGLSVSKGIVETHFGRFYLDTDAPNTRFVVLLPKIQRTTHMREAA